MTSIPSQTLKETSYEYGDAYQQQMVKYYYQSKIVSEENVMYLRVQRVKGLIEDAYALQSRRKEETVVVDVGCSIGQFAIECAKMGFRSYGVDFDASAIRIAQQLSAEENVTAEFYLMDIADWARGFPPIDIAVCADIFEHLHDDELGALLAGLRKSLSPSGTLVFHTAPQEYDYIFWRKKGDVGYIDLPWFFVPFKWLSDEGFTRLTRVTALAYDILSVMKRGLTYKERIKRADHPNPLTKSRLLDLLARAGYEVLEVGTETMELQMNPRHRAFFLSHSVTHRSLYGIARRRAPSS